MDSEIREIQEEKRQSSTGKEERVGLASTGAFDQDLYGPSDKFAGYEKFAGDANEGPAANGGAVGDVGRAANHPTTRAASINASQALLDADRGAGEVDMDYVRENYGSGRQNTRIADRESNYQAQRRNRLISPSRGDAFDGTTPQRSYKDIMLEQQLAREKQDVVRLIQKKQEEKAEEELRQKQEAEKAAAAGGAAAAKKKRRWDDT
ncbi:unnamed protein product, partial [Heterosigma akashiwo]